MKQGHIQQAIKIKKMEKFLPLIPLLLVSITAAPNPQTSPYRTAQVLDYGYIFSESSDVSVIVLACGGRHRLELTLKSFFYFNTYQLNKIYIVHCTTDTIPISIMLPFGYDAHQSKFEIIGATGQEYGIVDALETVYDKITTKYVYQLDAQWVMVKGFGFIEQAINVLRYGSTKSIKMSQVVSNYPYWRAVARLTQMKWSETGEAFHQVVPFAAEKYPAFTISPSLFEYEVVYTRILNKSLKNLCLTSKCIAQDLKSKYEYDKCCLWALGQEMYRQGYLQVYLNDGTGLPNHEYIEQTQ